MRKTKVPPNAAQGNGRGMRVLLVASLSLNLLIVGVFLGAMFMAGPWHGHHAPGLDRAQKNTDNQ